MKPLGHLLVARPESPLTFVKLSQSPALRGNQVNLSQRAPQDFNDLHEYYDPALEPLPQRQQQNPIPQSQRQPPTRSSSGTPSLRRTPRFEIRPPVQGPTNLSGGQSLPRPSSGLPQVVPQPPPIPAERTGISFDKSGSTTPQSFQNLVREESFWPKRSIHVSRRTHDAILFALEAIRKGSGDRTEPLSIDPVEEKARMSDLIGSQLPGGSGSSRPQNGGTNVTPGPAPPITTEPPRGVRTPTDVMRDRRAREAKKRAAEEEAARNREQDERLRRETEEYDDAGVVEDRNQSYRTQDRRQENMPSSFATAPAPQQRTSANPTQPRPAPAQQPSTGQSYNQPGQNNPAVPSSSTRRHRNEALENLNIPANTTAKPTGAAPQPQPTSQVAPRSQFPHAFERWETLSSHWEGLTSYWIRRLQENTNELDNKPIDQQLSRQIGDLSAAGANLFHAVVELQRLRASSERKFQRWFFETRNEQERAQEIQAQLQRQLETEREQRNVSGPAVEAARAEQHKAEELVREMRRELQISKEEARRAWEELGRREQEERDRTVALRSGEPVMIGGVQVVPMSHGGPSRGNTGSTAQRPVTRDGPIEGGPGPGIMGGQQPRGPPSRSQTGTTLDSPGAEERQFTHEPESPTSTDPFTEGRAHPSQHGSSPMRPTQPTTSSAAMAAARAATSAADPRFYNQASTGTAIPITIATSGPTPSNPARPPTSGTERSYVPSNISGGPSDEPHRFDPALYDDDAEYDSEADRERERLYAEQYSRAATQPDRTSQPLASYMSASAAPGTQQSPTAADLEAAAAASSAQYSAGSGWEGLTGAPRHRHPTRLSDILEERSGRTSPSRASYVSGERNLGEGYGRR